MNLARLNRLAENMVVVHNAAMTRGLFLIIICTLIGLMTAGCTAFLPAQRPLEDEAPGSYAQPGGLSQPVDRWWEEFDDSQLNALIGQAFQGGYTIREAWARFDQAMAFAVQAGAGRFPELSVQADALTGRQRTENGVSNTFGFEQYTLGLVGSYEVDLWRRIHSQRQAAVLAAEASREDLNATALTLAATVTDRWARIISQQRQIALLKEQLAANLIFLELVELRFRKALASALDVFQQRQIVEQKRAQIPLAEQRERLLLNELALLLGKPPAAVPVIQQADFKVPAKVPNIGLPIELLTSRPDVRASGMRLWAADWQLAAARADRLPSIRLTASSSYQAGEIESLLDNWLLNLTAGLTAPVFDGARRRSEVDRSEAVLDETLTAFRRTFITAIKEVEDALVTEETLRRHLVGLTAQLTAARSALKEARTRYRKGLNDYLPVLTQVVSVQNLEQDLIRRETDILITRVNLYRALGGARITDSGTAPWKIEDSNSNDVDIK